MNKNIGCLKEACIKENINYYQHHGTGNLISIEMPNKNYVFANWATPLNSQSIMQLCQDKDYFYSFFKDVIKMPETSSFFNPYSDTQYIKYLNQKTIFEIIRKVELKHDYPLIVKKNRGSWGINVFTVNDRRSLEKAVLGIFNIYSVSFDYVCLVQDQINIKDEFRVIYLNGEFQFAYRKVVDNAEFTGNISPLHWEGSKTEMVKDCELIQKLEDFCAPIFSKLMIPFCGLDVALDNTSELWLIEANSSPGFDHVIEDNGESFIIHLYQKILRSLAPGEKKCPISARSVTRS